MNTAWVVFVEFLAISLIVFVLLTEAHPQEAGPFPVFDPPKYQAPDLSLGNQGFAPQSNGRGYGRGGYGRGGFFGGGDSDTTYMDMTVRSHHPKINNVQPPWGGGFTSSE